MADSLPVPTKEEQKKIRADAARKQVRFDDERIDSLIPRIPRDRHTLLRRLSTENVGPRVSGVEDATRTETYQDDNGSGEETTEVTLQDYEVFKTEVSKLPTPRFTLTIDELNNDFVSKIEHYASISGLEEKPNCPFIPLTEAGKTQWPKINGSINVDTFKNLFEANPDALFQEFKLRTFGMQAAREQGRELHTIATGMSTDVAAIVDWGHHLGSRMINYESEAAVGGSLADPNPELLEKIQELESRIEEGNNSDPLLLARIRGLELQVSEANAAIADLIISRHQKTGSTAPQGSSTKAGPDQKRSAKYIDPPEWHNDPKVDLITFPVWLRRLTNKLTANADHWDTEELALGYVEGKLGGKIADSLAPYLEEQHPDRITTVKQLLAWLTSECDDPNKKILAKEKYKDLRMKNKDIFQEFRNAFVGLAGETYLKKSDWKLEFHDKLADVPRLRNQLVKEYLDPKVTFEAYCLIGQQVALDQERTNTLRTGKDKSDSSKDRAQNPGSSSRGGGTAGSTRGGARGGAASAGARGGVGGFSGMIGHHQKNGLSKEDLIKRTTDHLCYNCGKSGHISRECPEGSGTSYSGTTSRDARIEAIEKAFEGPASNKAKLDETETPSGN